MERRDRYDDDYRYSSDRSGRGKKQNEGRRGFILAFAIFLVIAVIISTGAYFYLEVFKVKNISFVGTDRYTDAQLKEYIFGTDESMNMLLLSRKLKKEPKKLIPFIQTYEVDLDYPDTVRVELYEKAVVAYFVYKNNYMYIDKDGIVVESSSERMDTIPCIDGLEFKSIVVNETLPVEDENVFNTILNISQYLSKYEVSVDRVFFNKDLSIMLYWDDVKINLGNGDNLNEKIYGIKQMSPGFIGLCGTLHMEDYNGDNSSVMFKKDE